MLPLVQEQLGDLCSRLMIRIPSFKEPQTRRNPAACGALMHCLQKLPPGTRRTFWIEIAQSEELTPLLFSCARKSMRGKLGTQFSGWISSKLGAALINSADCPVFSLPKIGWGGLC